MMEEMVESGFNVDIVNFMMTLMIQEQSVTNRLESNLILVTQSIIQKIGQFNDEDITICLEVYENETGNKDATRLLWSLNSIEW